MVDNYIGSLWRSTRTAEVCEVIWQQKTPGGIPEVSANTLITMVGHPSQNYITIPVSLLDISAGEFERAKNPAHDHPDQEPQSPGHFEANV